MDETQIIAAMKQAQAALYQSRPDEAAALIAPVLAADRDHVDALYIQAVAQRYGGHLSKAEKTLSHLKKIAPDFGRAFQEAGHLARARGDHAAAMGAYSRAVQTNPGLNASWRALADLQDAAGDKANAVQSRAQADRLSALPPALLSVINLTHEGKLLKAEGLCKQFLQKNRTHIEGIRLLADIAGRLGATDEAQFLLETALELSPNTVQLRLDYMQLLRKKQRYAEALEQAKKLYASDPQSPIFQSHLAIESMQTGDYDTAFDLFDKVLARLPKDAATLTSLGHALKTKGEREQAVSKYRAAFAARPDYGDAYYALANLKTYRFTDEEIAAMQRQEQMADLSYQNRIHFCFALGKAFEDKKDFDRAFEYYERGNELKRIQSRYDADDMTLELRQQIEFCTPELFERQSGKGHAAPDPIFILGLPRAGSTLLEQIIASHSQVDGTLELPNILALSSKLRGRGRGAGQGLYPQNLGELSQEQLQKFGQDFIEQTQIHRAGAPFFIDKMPNNFRHIGLIHLILPNAKIIDARRHPMACCFSGFKQLFAEGQEFTYGLKQVGQYYRDYVDVMDHWDAVLPGKVLRVQYEDVVADTQAQVRRILDYLGLPFEQACVDFHETKRSVRTASSEQVRQPIYKSGLEQWRNFEPHLEPLIDSLGPVLKRYPIS